MDQKTMSVKTLPTSENTSQRKFHIWSVLKRLAKLEPISREALFLLYTVGHNHGEAEDEIKVKEMKSRLKKEAAQNYIPVSK